MKRYGTIILSCFLACFPFASRILAMDIADLPPQYRAYLDTAQGVAAAVACLVQLTVVYALFAAIRRRYGIPAHRFRHTAELFSGLGMFVPLLPFLLMGTLLTPRQLYISSLLQTILVLYANPLAWGMHLIGIGVMMVGLVRFLGLRKPPAIYAVGIPLGLSFVMPGVFSALYHLYIGTVPFTAAR